jgi:hypothetical protein
MNLLLQTQERALISLSSEELVSLANTLNEVCNGIHIDDDELESRLGTSRKALLELHATLLSKMDVTTQKYELVEAFPAPASVMVRAISVYGDPVELSTSEAQKLVDDLQQALQVASSKPGHPSFRIFLHGNAPFADRPVAARSSCCVHDISTPPTRSTRIARRVPLRLALCAARLLVR